MFRAHKNFSRNFVLALCLLTLVGATSCTRAAGDQSRHSQGETEPNIGRGLIIISVFEGGPAQRAGLQPMDVLSKYGEFDIVDSASYFAARDAYERSPDDTVRIVVWRGDKKMTPMVPTGKLGVETNEYNLVCYQFDPLMAKANRMAEAPDYMRDREYKEFFKSSPEEVLEEARRLIDSAEQEGKLTPTQVLISRIYMIFDDAPAEEIKKQSQMLVQLFATQPDSFIEYLGQDLFFKNKRYRPAIECFKRHLRVNPSDVSVRLNLGVAAYHLRMWNEAAAAVDYVFDNKLGLSEHGFRVAYQVKAMAALGQHDYVKSIEFAEKSFELNRETFDISLVQMAAAESGDLQKLEQASLKFEQTLPEQFNRIRYQVDAIKAYALVKTNQRERARELALKWKDVDRIEGKLNRYWGIYAGGSNVVKNWKELIKD